MRSRNITIAAMTTSLVHDSSQLAETYDRLSDTQFESGKRLAEQLKVAAGERVLDVGCGTGRLARWLAERVGPRGIVVGVDPLAERVALARAHGGEIRFEVGRAEDLAAFDDGSFDVVCMSSVFHWLADKAKALAEARRVLRPGGRLGVTTLSRDLVAAGTVGVVMRSALQRAPYAGQVDLSQLSVTSSSPTTTEMIALVIASGLRLDGLYVKANARTHANGEEAVAFLESSSFGNFLRVVPEALRPVLRRDLADAFEALKDARGVVIDGWGTLFIATRP
jgi:ubiquinone/menaquinone biosynthesis C-methylase UbiE